MPYRHDFRAMASPCSIQIFCEDDLVAETAAVAAEDEIRRIEWKYSRYRPDSEISRINAVASSGGTTDVDPETAGLLRFAFDAYRMSDGLFDITSGALRKAWDFGSQSLPDEGTIKSLLGRVGLDKASWKEPMISFRVARMEIDFGGIGKEYAADRAAATIRAFGLASALIDLGGDLVALGPQPDGKGWDIGIQHPRQSHTLMARTALGTGALASSGDYERFFEVDGIRYCHILNPRTGWPSRGLAGVSVWADQCLVAGCVATIAMLKGQDGAAYLANTGLKHLYMTDDGRRGGTPG